jgi:hypothetical protein
MTLLGIDCHAWPMVLFGAGSALAAFVIVKWAREEEAPLKPWRWSDPPRRPRQEDDPFWSNAVGMFMALFAIVYAIQDPICG